MSTTIAMPRTKVPMGKMAGRLSRTGQVIGSFFGVLGAYWLYWLIVVPLVEPNLSAQPLVRATEEQLRAARDAQANRQMSLGQFFPPGSWELDNPAIWESDNSLLLFKTPRPGVDGQLDVPACTVLFFKEQRVAGEPVTLPPTILRAPHGALLRFTRPVELKSVDVNHLELASGQIRGPISITREESQPGAADDLVVNLKQDLQLSGNRLYTPELIEFRLGRSYGSGREMRMILGSDDKAMTAKSFEKESVRTLELLREVTMTLEIPAETRTSPAQPAKPAIMPAADAARSFLRITSQGPFQFDFAKNTASFHDRVDVVRLANGPSDQMSCELLTIKLARGGTTTPAPARPGDAPPIQVIEARGDPVIVRSPSRGAYIHCKALDIHPGAGDLVGRVVAFGPGIMQAEMADSPLGRCQAQWVNEFRFEPAGQQQVASLTGAASVRFPEMGELKGDELAAFLTPPNQAAGRPDWQIERMLCQGNVAVDGLLDGKHLTANTMKLEAWVRQPAPVAPGTNSAAQQAAAAPAQKPPQRARSAGVETEIDARGRHIQMELVRQGEDYLVSQATIDGAAQIIARGTQGNEQRPLVVTGEKLHVAGADTPQTLVTIAGAAERPTEPARPASIEGDGLNLFGGVIRLERHTNHLWIDGPGRLTMLVSQDMNGAPLASPRPLDVTWQESMHFRGNQAVFERGVRAQTDEQFMLTERLTTTLDRRIDFSNPGAMADGNPQNRPKLAALQSMGKTYLEGRELDPITGQQAAIRRLELFDLSVNTQSGAIDGRGPGWLTNVGLGSQADMIMPAQPVASAPAARANKDDQLYYLNVRFQRFLKGDLNRRTVTVGEPTKTVYGPIPNWNSTLDADTPEQLGPEGFVMSAKQLTVVQMPARGPKDKPWMELVAEGSVLGEGAQFTTRSHRVAYSQEKQQLMLQGDELSNAAIYYRLPNGERSHSEAQTIRYSIRTQQVNVTGMGSINMTIPGAKIGPKGPAK